MGILLLGPILLLHAGPSGGDPRPENPAGARPEFRQPQDDFLFCSKFLLAVEGLSTELLRQEIRVATGGEDQPWEYAEVSVASKDRIDVLDETVPAAETAQLLREAGHDRGDVRAWYLASPRGVEPFELCEMGLANSENPWDAVHRLIDEGPDGWLWRFESRLRDVAESARIVAVEPDLSYANRRFAKRAAHHARRTAAVTPPAPTTSSCDALQLTRDRGAYWPPRGGEPPFAWHRWRLGLHDPDNSVCPQYRPHPARASIAHLDTGLQENHLARPMRLSHRRYDHTRSERVDESWSESARGSCRDPYNTGFLKNPGHGTGTAGILAAGCIEMTGHPYKYCDFLGVAPEVSVDCHRISDSVIHLFPSRMAKALERARADRADVVSLSMGGLPSLALRDQVRNAYSYGMSVFAAAGNHFRAPIIPLRTPTTTVFPARFSTVMAVSGVRSDDVSYTRGPSTFRLLARWFRDFGSWALRGNHVAPKRPSQSAPTQHGALAAFSPHVAWPVYGEKHRGLVRADGSGTSAATPQAAGTAALWIHHLRWKGEFPTYSHAWMNAEAVYHVLTAAAKRDFEGYDARLFGAGILDSAETLRRGPPAEGDLRRRPQAKIGIGWVFDFFLSILRTDTRADRALLHARAAHVEVAQLALRSKRLQRKSVSVQASPRSKRAACDMLGAVAADRHRSTYLRSLIGEEC